jgi:fumarate reductase iron-sulfur subunit
MVSGRTFMLRIRRGSPGDGRPSEYVQYQVPLQEKMTVLDAVAWVQRHEQFDLAYRFACRVGMCGTCAMVINGRESWACRTLVENLSTGTVSLDPLRNLPVVKDLVVDMRPFFGAMTKAIGHFVAAAGEEDWAQAVNLPAERRMIDPHIECISCGACYSACTVIRWDPEYLGPAALNRAATLVMDSRDSARTVRLDVVAGEHGCWSCHSQFTCTEVCPMDLRPTGSIGYLKRHALVRLLRPSATAREPEAVHERPRPGTGAPPGEPTRPGEATRMVSRLGAWSAIAAFVSLFSRPVACAASFSVIVGAIYLMGIRADARVPRIEFFVPEKPVQPVALAGALVFEEQHCEACHSVLGVGGHAARDLWIAGKRRDREWLRELFTDPDRVLPAGTMPAFPLEEREIDALAEYVHGLDFSYRQAQRIDRPVARGGGELYRSGCLDCHRLEGSPSGPLDLAGEGSRRSLGWLTAYLTATTFHRDVPGMPSLSDQRKTEIALYLSLQK